MTTARIHTTCRSKPRRVRQSPAHRGGALARPIRRYPVRLSHRGAKLRAAGIARRAFPLEASEARSAAGAKA
ncbi:hypothetical protein SFPGR_25500 [Sulfuriferula plumbiphila]|nr:hypothetical protein SFPGR_25500 [Sulfuriferula plumbiphila]